MALVNSSKNQPIFLIDADAAIFHPPIVYVSPAYSSITTELVEALVSGFDITAIPFTIASPYVPLMVSTYKPSSVIVPDCLVSPETLLIVILVVTFLFKLFILLVAILLSMA